MPPIGVDLFEKLRTEGYYYVDKTRFISELVKNKAEVNLFTRPRRFGKTLTLSALKEFFEIGGDPSLFEGLDITKDTAFCEQNQNRYPVIFITMKGVEGRTFEEAYEMLRLLVRSEASRLSFLLESGKIEEKDKLSLRRLIYEKDTQADIVNSLNMLSLLLHKHYGKKAIILIDEYDVPLDKAFHNNYYNDMVTIIRLMFGFAFKTSKSMRFAVLTGALRVSKESIFTGVNNPAVWSITDNQFSEYIGFTDEEVRHMLADYDVLEKYDTAKEWYDGYNFGGNHIYCPWDIVNYCAALRYDRNARPKMYWINSSGNDIVRHLAEMADESTRNAIEELIAGKTIERMVMQELTYSEMYQSVDHVWSVMFLTGYLTQDGETRDGLLRLKLPNREIRGLFVTQVSDWFKAAVRQDKASVRAILSGVAGGDAQEIENNLNVLMQSMISYFDANESFYHGFLLGLLGQNSAWTSVSNRETGNGRSDICVRNNGRRIGYILELKYAREFAGLDKASETALRQAEDMRYVDGLRADGIRDVWLYGIAFHKKWCRVVVKRAEPG
ncbi:MAG: ATP-binding protein [Oscillospiraceae bacterium]|nr:ATP-binding protein [Oscillospiraceae bacterium]